MAKKIVKSIENLLNNGPIPRRETIENPSVLIPTREEVTETVNNTSSTVFNYLKKPLNLCAVSLIAAGATLFTIAMATDSQTLKEVTAYGMGILGMPLVIYGALIEPLISAETPREEVYFIEDGTVIENGEEKIKLKFVDKFGAKYNFKDDLPKQE